MPYTADIDFDPLPVIEQMRAPKLALQGANDPIVPAQETAALFARVQRRKRNFAVRVLGRANHSMSPRTVTNR